METQLEDVLRRMVGGDFSILDSVRTRSGTEYRILSGEEEAPPETVALRPVFAQCAQGRVTLQGHCYGRAQEKKKPDGTPVFPDGCPVPPRRFPRLFCVIPGGMPCASLWRAERFIS